jgi:hypothetical protein
MCVFQPGLCPQCTFHSAHFAYDGTGGYETNCGRCGHSESYRPEYDPDDGVFCGYTHVMRKGAGVLWFRCSGERPIFCHYLHSPTEVLAAEHWLREGLSTGVVETGTCFLTRWNEQTRQVECVVGELLDFLAGKIVRRSGVPERSSATIRGDC